MAASPLATTRQIEIDDWMLSDKRFSFLAYYNIKYGMECKVSEYKTRMTKLAMSENRGANREIVIPEKSMHIKRDIDIKVYLSIVLDAGDTTRFRILERCGMYKNTRNAGVVRDSLYRLQEDGLLVVILDGYAKGNRGRKIRCELFTAKSVPKNDTVTCNYTKDWDGW